MKEDNVLAMARNIKETTYERLPSEIVEVTKKLIIDTVAVGLCGSTGAGIRELAELFKGWAGKGESTVWVYGGKLPCISAAQVNASMAHASDYDDTHDPSPVHTGAVAVPAALAISEMQGGVDGKSVITAVALAVDLTIRLCMACKIPMRESGWHYTALHGSFNAAAVAGKLMNLNEEAVINMLGLAYHQAAGNVQGTREGTLAKRMGTGFAVRNGIMSALMAQKGITGAKNFLEGNYGLYNIYHRGEYTPEPLTAGLGERFEGAGLSFKPYPCCRDNHAAIDAARALVLEHKIRPEDVDAIGVRVSHSVMIGLCEPLEVKRNPKTTVDAQFSIPWTVGTAMAFGKAGLDAFTEKAIHDKKVLAISNKVIPKEDQSLNQRGVTPAVVEIQMRGGKVYSKRVDHPYGSPENPMSLDDTINKLRDCAAFAAKPVKKEKLEKLIESTSRLEMIKDVREVARLLDWS